MYHEWNSQNTNDRKLLKKCTFIVSRIFKSEALAEPYMLGNFFPQNGVLLFKYLNAAFALVKLNKYYLIIDVEWQMIVR